MHLFVHSGSHPVVRLPTAAEAKYLSMELTKPASLVPGSMTASAHWLDEWSATSNFGLSFAYTAPTVKLPRALDSAKGTASGEQKDEGGHMSAPQPQTGPVHLSSGTPEHVARRPSVPPSTPSPSRAATKPRARPSSDHLDYVDLLIAIPYALQPANFRSKGRGADGAQETQSTARQPLDLASGTQHGTERTKASMVKAEPIFAQTSGDGFAARGWERGDETSSAPRPPPAVIATSATSPRDADPFPLSDFPILGAPAVVPPVHPVAASEAWSPRAPLAPEWERSTVVPRTAEQEKALWDRTMAPLLAARAREERKRERGRQRALEVGRRLRASHHVQLGLPKTVWIEVLLELTASDRWNFALSCKEACAVVGEMTTFWDVTRGLFYQPQRTARGAVRPQAATQHAITVVRTNEHHARRHYIGHQISMMKRLTVSLDNVGRLLRHLQFHRTPLLTAAWLGLVLPAMPHLAYLGIYKCDLVDVGDVEDLLRFLRFGSRRAEVQLDLYPSQALRQQHFMQVNLLVALPALLARVLPQAKAQGARLVEPGRLFPRWLEHVGSQMSDRLLATLEAGIQDDWLLHDIGVKKWQGAREHFSRGCKDASVFVCRICGARLLGCFFARAQLAGGGELPQCWGCRLLDELQVDRDDVRAHKDMYDAVDAWVFRCRTLDVALADARQHRPVPAAEDQTWAERYDAREREMEYERQVRNGVIVRGQPMKESIWTRPRSGRGGGDYSAAEVVLDEHGREW
ncbi:MAG: hypothetical protein M1826_001422 [Phylliscum demangeonii]|nr:MAG: hypothetical protein M1826_001422 [Phylliscum demangeonii]